MAVAELERVAAVPAQPLENYPTAPRKLHVVRRGGALPPTGGDNSDHGNNNERPKFSPRELIPFGLAAGAGILYVAYLVASAPIAH